MFFLKKRKNNLIGFSVFTQSGHKLGVVVLVKKNKLSEKIEKIYVKKRFLGIPLGRLFIIDNSQIIKIEKTKVIVSDAFILEKIEDVVYGTENA